MTYYYRFILPTRVSSAFDNEKYQKIATNYLKAIYASTSRAYMQVRNVTGSDVRMSERPLLACLTTRKCSKDTSSNSANFGHTFV